MENLLRGKVLTLFTILMMLGQMSHELYRFCQRASSLRYGFGIKQASLYGDKQRTSRWYGL